MICKSEIEMNHVVQLYMQQTVVLISADLGLNTNTQHTFQIFYKLVCKPFFSFSYPFQLSTILWWCIV